MWRACSRCGKIHPSKTPCKVPRIYRGGKERELRNTNKWHKKAKEIKERSNYLCSVCKENNIYTYDNLEVHHIEKVKDKPEKLLDDDNLICLCVQCHKQADKGTIKAEYLRKLVQERDNNPQ